jgi:YegS/Rv2252/BmrU family lipid kinase
MNCKKQVRVLINPGSGLGAPIDRICKALIKHWEEPNTDLKVQFSVSKEDGQKKAQKAIEEHVDTFLVAGGDGVVNSIGSELIDTEIALGVIPTGSGNGFARHFNIPMDIEKAIEALASAHRQKIDVGYANNRPFFVTCSLAWDAALVKTFDKSPVRGILPYIFAAMYEFFEYQSQPFTILFDNGETIEIHDPLLFTAANLTQYGGGARIAPNAKADDGQLQLVTLRQKDLPWVLPMLGKVFDGTIHHLNEIKTKSFNHITVKRKKDGPMQLDGELINAPTKIEIYVKTHALTVLVP